MKLLIPGEYIALLTTLVTTLLVFFAVPTNMLWSLALILLVTTILLTDWFFLRKRQHSHYAVVGTVIAFVTFLLVQILIISTGNLFSPFLVAVYLVTLGTGFLLNQKTAVLFIFFTSIALSFQIVVNPVYYELVMADPWSIAIYCIAALAILPLMYLLTSNYHIKDIFLDLMTKELSLRQSREELIFESVSDLIIVVNTKSQIISMNELARKAVGKHESELIFKPITDFFELESPQNLNHYLEAIVKTQTPIVLDGVNLVNVVTKQSREVSMQVKPLFDSQERVSQVTIIINQNQSFSSQSKKLISLESIRIFLEKNFELLVPTVIEKLPHDQAQSFIKMLHIQDDYIQALRLEQPINDAASEIVDISQLCLSVIEGQSQTAAFFGVTIENKIPVSTPIPSNLSDINIEALTLTETHSSYKTVTSRNWLKVALDKLVEIQLHLASPQQGNITCELTAKSDVLIITVSSNQPAMNSVQVDKMFNIQLDKLPVNMASSLYTGLEGYIAKTILNKLQLPLEISLKNNTLSFIIQLPVRYS